VILFKGRNEAKRILNNIVKSLKGYFHLFIKKLKFQFYCEMPTE